MFKKWLEKRKKRKEEKRTRIVHGPTITGQADHSTNVMHTTVYLGSDNCSDSGSSGWGGGGDSGGSCD